MEPQAIKIIDLSRYRDSDSQARIPVPLWFLDLISDAETLDQVDQAIEVMKLSIEDELCKRKSIHLATVRKKVILHES
jgi:hypothetical protein